jgi:hypothetical protein
MHFARRMQVQERLTDQIKNCIQEALNPLGVAVVIEAQHMCMQMRGIKNKIHVFFTGAFEEDKTRREFISLISINLVKFSFQNERYENSLNRCNRIHWKSSYLFNRTRPSCSLLHKR